MSDLYLTRERKIGAYLYSDSTLRNLSDIVTEMDEESDYYQGVALVVALLEAVHERLRNDLYN